MTRSAEDVPSPTTDEEALEILSGGPNSRAFLAEYEKLRDEGKGVGQASSSWGTGSGCGT
jgi:hypothetical protein